MGNKIQATCRCGEVKFETEEQPVIQLCCHCADCRSALGTDYTNISFFDVSASTVSGNRSQYKFVTEEGNATVREYCPNCEVVMFDKSSGFPALIGVISEQIKPPYTISPVGHIWVNSKLPHVKIPDGVKQFPKGFYSS